jgi:CxxC motif-containing protein (DUF1111 family)
VLCCYWIDMKRNLIVFFLILQEISSGCAKNPDTLEPLEENEANSGGNLTTFDTGENAFGHEASGLDDEGYTSFVVGNSFFRNVWTSAPASATARDGLGPLFNATSCGGCHNLDGRAKPPTDITNQGLGGLLFRLSIAGNTQENAPKPDPNYGGQLNNLSLQDALPEGNATIAYIEVSGKYSDGSSYSLRKPSYKFNDLTLGPFHSSLMFSPRIAPQLPGLGLIEAIPENSIRANEDQADQNNDGISGRVNIVWDFKNKRSTIGRFGWKANQPNLFQQTAGAFLGDMGITSSIFPNENLVGKSLELYKQLPNGGTPEIEDKNLDAVVFYMQTLKVPARRNIEDSEVRKGKALFTKINCTGCHISNFSTASHPIAVLRNQTIRPYSDLLLHDMGEGLADNRPDFEATGQEWRTPPLWGIGMIKTVNKHTFLLHDGRARNFEEAILWHGGEAQKSADEFKNLTKIERTAIIKFLENL